MRRTKLENQIYVEQISQLCAKGLNLVQIAARLGSKRELVRRVCKTHGISVVAVEGYESRAGSSVKTACAAIESSGSANGNPSL